MTCKEVGYVARDDWKSVTESRRADQAVAVGMSVGDVQRCDFLQTERRHWPRTSFAHTAGEL